MQLVLACKALQWHSLELVSFGCASKSCAWEAVHCDPSSGRLRAKDRFSLLLWTGFHVQGGTPTKQDLTYPRAAYEHTLHWPDYHQALMDCKSPAELVQKLQRWSDAGDVYGLSLLELAQVSARQQTEVIVC